MDKQRMIDGTPSPMAKSMGREARRAARQKRGFSLRTSRRQGDKGERRPDRRPSMKACFTRCRWVSKSPVEPLLSTFLQVHEGHPKATGYRVNPKLIPCGAQ